MNDDGKVRNGISLWRLWRRQDPARQRVRRKLEAERARSRKSLQGIKRGETCVALVGNGEGSIEQPLQRLKYPSARELEMILGKVHVVPSAINLRRLRLQYCLVQ